MARTPYPRTDRELLLRIGRSAGGKAGYKQLVREFGLGGGRERRLLVEQLTRMVARGDLLRLENELWAVPKAVVTERVSAPVETVGNDTQKPKSASGPPRSGRDRLVSGKLDMHRDGFGFVRPEASSNAGRVPAGDIFIPPNEINGAMQGDVVLVDEAAPGRDGRRSGRVARVLTRRNPTVVGIFHYAHRARRDEQQPFGLQVARGNYVTPLDERVGNAIEIAQGEEEPARPAEAQHRTLGDEAVLQLQRWEAKNPEWPLEGLAVDVEITSFPQTGRPARGRVIEVLGPPDAFGVDVEIVIRKHHIPHSFPSVVLAEAKEEADRNVATLTEEELALREDFRGLAIVTIDGETARDFDDAVLVRQLPNGNTELQVHIADVSAYVHDSSGIDTEARVRGTSVYFPDRAVPMLPHALSSGMCSLLPNEDRLVLSCVMEVDGEGEILGYRVAEGIIRSVRRMTYTSVQQCLNASPDRRNGVTPEPTAEDIAERERIALEHPDLPASFDAMLELALHLNAKRVRRGSIDFDLPEPVIEFDPDGNMKAVVRSQRGWAHRLIEEFMLSANECVATWLQEQGIPSIYRIHEMPDPKRIVEFEETAAAFGQSLGIGSLPVRKLTMKSDRRDMQRRNAHGRDSHKAPSHEIPERIPVTPQMYQKLVRKIAGRAEESILTYLMLRSLKQARYAEKNEGHFALASPCYTHFTSPIRRYPDLIVHRLLRAMLRDGADPRGGAIHSNDVQPWKDEREQRRADVAHRVQSKGTKERRIGWADEGASTRPFGDDTDAPKRRGNHVAPIAAEELNDIAVESSQAERRAADAERELIEWKKIKFMADKVGDDFHAIILSVTKHGFFVELNDMFIEGLVPLGSLVGDHYAFRDTDRTICGARTGHCFAIGQRVEVILDRIDRQQRRLQFALLPGTEPQANTGAGHASVRAAKSEKKKEKAKQKKTGKAKKRDRKKR